MLSSKCSIQLKEGRGRCVVADRDMKAGEIVVQEEPYAAVVASDYSEVCCYYCMKLCIHSTIYALNAFDPVRYILSTYT